MPLLYDGVQRYEELVCFPQKRRRWSKFKTGRYADGLRVRKGNSRRKTSPPGLHAFLLQVRTDDGMPDLLCTDCEMKLCVAFDFKSLCEKTEIELRKFIGEEEMIEIKTDIDVHDYMDLNYGDDDEESSSYTCKVCDKALNSKKNLLTHMRRHRYNKIGEGEEKELSTLVEMQESISSDEGKSKSNFECKYCQKILTTAMGLKIHTRRHTGVNLHMCNVSVNFTSPICWAIFFKFAF